QAKKRDEAWTFLQRALESYPVLADYSLYYLGLISQDNGQTAEALAFFQRLLAEYPDSIWSGHTQLALAKFAVAEQDWSTAMRRAEPLYNSKSFSASLRQAAMFVLAQAREGQGDVSDAYNLYQELRRLSPQSSLGKMAKDHVQQLRMFAPSQFGLNDEQDYL